MISRHGLVLAIYLQKRGFSFAVFDGQFTPVDWAVHEARNTDKNAWCVRHVDSLLKLHTPDILVLQDMSDGGTRRVSRIRKLNQLIARLADDHGMLVRTYSRADVLTFFTNHYGATTKQMIAETIARHVPALSLYVPPARKAWSSEHPRMGIFEAAALAWMYFQEIEQQRAA